MERKNTRGNPRGPAHGGGEFMWWDFESRGKKRAHHAQVKARRKQSVQQRKK